MFDLAEIGRLADPTDNCAIATRTLAAGTVIRAGALEFTLSHGILVGHRFAVQVIPAGIHLLSWQMPFGTALRDIAPGEYVCNEEMLVELRQRQLEFPLPAEANFSDEIPPFVFDPASFTPAEPLPRRQETATFQGYPRPGGRGVGTRNHIILLAANGTVAGFTRALAERLQGAAGPFANVDGVVAAVHTEGVRADGHNKDLLLRSLAGYITHPNAGAVLIIDNGVNGLRNEMIRRYMVDNGYPLDAVTHQFFSVDGPFTGKLKEAAAIVTAWLPVLDRQKRSPQPVSALKIALQCGGSDAFSGISGNPLIAWVAKELIRQGGAANLAETDELQGAEAYILRRARDGATAARFLEVVERFKSWAERHGQSASANPSGGNRYRGLYNIYLKSLGAAAKRHPDVPLDYVIDYSEPMDAPGYYFMDSPGNDLESIAGQVGSGCNLIFFVTGNGSITNFPFVPTIKVVTTSERFTQLQADMDVDAGRYLTGTPMDELGAETFTQMLAVASGELSVGERAGHAQLQIWRDWRLGAGETVATLGAQQAPSGQPLNITTPAAPEMDLGALPAKPIALILPTSLCSGQIARMAAERFNRATAETPYSRFAALVHTEGCGVTTQTEFLDTLLGYMVHPLVGACLLLEHGCEKTHNHYWQGQMRDAGLALADYGWASIQGDGGIEKSMANVWTWFAAQSEGFADPTGPRTRRVGEPLTLGLLGTGVPDEAAARALADLAAAVVGQGGSVIMPEGDELLESMPFRQRLGLSGAIEPTLRYAGWRYPAGLHIMADPSVSWTETLTGLGATGAELLLVWGKAHNGHPLVPLLQVGLEGAGEWDLALVGDPAGWPAALADLVRTTRAGQHTPLAMQQHNLDFQITRGLLGISL